MSREKAKAFFDLVREMREAQKAYFMTRTKETLDRSKRLERDVDKVIKDALRAMEERRNPTLGL